MSVGSLRLGRKVKVGFRGWKKEFIHHQLSWWLKEITWISFSMFSYPTLPLGMCNLVILSPRIVSHFQANFQFSYSLADRIAMYHPKYHYNKSISTHLLVVIGLLIPVEFFKTITSDNSLCLRHKVTLQNLQLGSELPTFT